MYENLVIQQIQYGGLCGLNLFLIKNAYAYLFIIKEYITVYSSQVQYRYSNYCLQTDRQI